MEHPHRLSGDLIRGIGSELAGTHFITALQISGTNRKIAGRAVAMGDDDGVWKRRGSLDVAADLVEDLPAKADKSDLANAPDCKVQRGRRAIVGREKFTF